MRRSSLPLAPATVALFAALAAGGALPAPAQAQAPMGAAADDATFGATPIAEDAWDVPGKVVVDARDDLAAADLTALLAGLGVTGTPAGLFDQTRTMVVDVAPSRVASLLAALAGDARVERAEPLAQVRALFVPDDPRFGDQWHMERVGAPSAWDWATGRGVTVAVVDTGIACEDHGPFRKGTDLAATRCVPGWNFVAQNEHANDDQGHGSHVAGTIAQSTHNGLGATGLAFQARLMPVKVLDERGFGTTVEVANGIRWAADHGAHVINLSLGGPRRSKVLDAAIEHALSRGVVVVAAAGNSGGRVGYPAGCEGVLAVSATRPDDQLAVFSSRGPEVFLAAPGVGVLQQTVCNRGRDKCELFPSWNGTSMASPHVAGAAALLVSQGVTNPREVQAALARSARVVDPRPEARHLYGAGVLDAAAAVKRVALSQLAVRAAALFAIVAVLAWWAKRAGAKGTNPLRASFVLPALVTGTGLAPFLPWLAPRMHLAADLASRPLGDWDLFVGASVHRLLPLANAFLPLGLALLLYGAKRARPFVAGVGAGTAAYLASLAVLGHAGGPFGATLAAAWCALHAALSVALARIVLVER